MPDYENFAVRILKAQAARDAERKGIQMLRERLGVPILIDQRNRDADRRNKIVLDNMRTKREDKQIADRESFEWKLKEYEWDKKVEIEELKQAGKEPTDKPSKISEEKKRQATAGLTATSKSLAEDRSAIKKLESKKQILKGELIGDALLDERKIEEIRLIDLDIEGLKIGLTPTQKDSLNKALDLQKLVGEIHGETFIDPRTTTPDTTTTPPDIGDITGGMVGPPLPKEKPTSGWNPQWNAEYEQWKTENGILDDQYKDWFQSKKAEGY